MRLVGPNCLGVLNTGPAVRLNATFAPGRAARRAASPSRRRAGRTVSPRSTGRRRGLGLSSFVSLGNKAELSGNDFLRFWEDDPRTEWSLLYLESFGNPRRFGQIARRVDRAQAGDRRQERPLAAGSRAATSRTGALIAARRHDGRRPLRPRGRGARRDARRAARRRRGAGRPAAAARRAGRDRDQWGRPGDRLRRRLRGGRAAAWSRCSRPRARRCGACSPPPRWSATRSTCSSRRRRRTSAARSRRSPPIPASTRSSRSSSRIARTRRRSPVIRARRRRDTSRPAGPRRRDGAPASRPAVDAGVPVYPTPEQAVRALGACGRLRPPSRRVRMSRPFRRRDSTPMPRRRSWRKRSPPDRDGWSPDVDALLLAYGLPRRGGALGDLAADVGARAEELGGAVALKAILPWVLHKTEAGAVRLGLEDAGAVTEAARELAAPAGGAALPRPGDGASGRRDAGRPRR